MKLRKLTSAPEENEDDENTKAYLERKKARLKFERSAFSFAVQKGEYVPLAEIEAAVIQKCFPEPEAKVRDELVRDCLRVLAEIERLSFPDLFQRALPQSGEASAEKNEGT